MQIFWESFLVDFSELYAHLSTLQGINTTSHEVRITEEVSHKGDKWPQMPK